MMATHAKPKLHLIVAFIQRASTDQTIVDFISVLEGARFASNFDGLSNLDSSKLIVNFSEISFHFCEDYRIFREGEYQPYLGLQPQFGLRPQLGFWSQNDL